MSMTVKLSTDKTPEKRPDGGVENTFRGTSLTTVSIAGAATVWLISANDLLIGDVVYLTPGHGWSRQLTDALAIAEKSDALTVFTRVSNDQAVVVGHTLLEANQHADGTLTLSHYRDRIRFSGPTHTYAPTGQP